jgi:hypothetical protein
MATITSWTAAAIQTAFDAVTGNLALKADLVSGRLPDAQLPTDAVTTSSLATTLTSALAVKADLVSGVVPDSQVPAIAVKRGEAYLNVKDPAYGAVGNGTTDDISAINAAIAAAAAGGVKKVKIPFGNYAISAPIQMKSGVQLEGSGASYWPFRFPSPICSIKPLSSFSGECVISMLGADITGNSLNEGFMRISDIELDGSSLPAGSVSGIHAQGEVMDVQLARVTIKNMTHNGIHTNIGTGTKAPHDWWMDSVVCYGNALYGFSMSMTDGFIRNCIASSNTADGWFLGPFGGLTMEGCQALWNNGHGLNIAGGSNTGNLTVTSFLTDRNGHDGVHLGPSSGIASTPFIFSGLTLSRDGKNGGSGGGNYAGLSINGCASPVIINGVVCITGVDDNGAGTNSPQYGLYATNNAFVSVTGGYLHGDSAGWFDAGGNTVIRRGPNIGEATGPKATPTFVYGNGVTFSDGHISTPGRALGIPRPHDHNALGWTIPPESCRSDSQLTAGVVYLNAVYISEYATAAKIEWGINTIGATATAGANWVGLYNSVGTRLAAVGVDAKVTVQGATAEAISQAVTPGVYYIAYLFNATTMPKLYCGSDLNATLANFNLGSLNGRFLTSGTGQTTLPSTITMSGTTLSQKTLFGAVI